MPHLKPARPHKIRPSERPARQQGFTLVEIAIVLVIVGLLLGAVLKGQELIFNTKIKSTFNLSREMQARMVKRCVPRSVRWPIRAVRCTSSLALVTHLHWVTTQWA